MMKKSEIFEKAKSSLSRATRGAAGVGRGLAKVLSFSLADERIAPGRCLAACLEEGAVSVACGSRILSQVRIEAMRRYPCEAGKYPPPEVLANTLNLARNELRALQAEVTLIIPRTWVIVRTADFPRVVKDTLADVVGYELDRLTPFDADRAAYDFQIIGEEEDRLKIMLAVMNAELLDPYLQALAQKGIVPQRVIASLSAFGALCRHLEGEGTSLFLNVRPGGYEGGLFEGGCLRSSFGKRFSSDDGEENTRIVADDINPLLAAVQREGQDTVLIADAPAALRPCLAERIAVPFRWLEELDLRLKFLHPEKSVPFEALGGVLESLRTSLRGMNLLDKGRHRAVRPPLAATGVLLGALAVLGILSLVGSLESATRKVEAIDREIAVRKGEVRSIETMKRDATALEKEIGAIEGFKGSRPMVLNLLKELTQILPKNAWLVRIRTADATVSIEGYAASATELLPKLEASRYFQKVEFASPTYRDARMNADRFAIKMEMEGRAGEGGKDAKK